MKKSFSRRELLCLTGKVLTGLQARWDELNTHDVVYVIRQSGMEKIV